MRRRLRTLRIVVPAALAVLELSHPTLSAGTVSQAVLAAGGWWLPLHLLLLAGYLVVGWLLWMPATIPRILLGVFLVCNTAFIGADGVAVGWLAVTDPGAADRLWESPFVAALANLTGAAWSASLLGIAACLADRSPRKLVLLGLGLTWLTFVVTVQPIGAPSVVSRLVALATGAWVVYMTGRSAVPFALLVFAAVMPQHVGPDAALGMLLVGLALARLPKDGW